MRLKNSIRNIATSLGSQLLTQILSFINRTVFIYSLGIEYLGISGLFTNVLAMLSLAELGVGSAIIYNMYKPIADNDEEKIKSLMKLYKKVYITIGTIIGIIGILLLPFIDKIVTDSNQVSNLRLIYLMFLFNSASSYFFSYKRSIITANQKEYINIINDQKFNILKNIIQILSLLILPNYILYLIIQIMCTFISNAWISKIANDMYPILKSSECEELSKSEKRTIAKHVLATMSHKVGGVVVNSTDNIMISSLIGLSYVGIVSNYSMILGIINTIILQIFNSLTASVGNLNASGDIEKSEDILYKLFLVGFWIYGMCTILLSILFNPFINLWIGENYVLNNNVVIVIIINFFIMGMRRANIVYNSTLGLFWHDRYKPWFESVINVIASIILLKKYGLIGVFLGTLISTITTSLWFEPYILYKYGFKKSPILYVKKYLLYVGVLIWTSFFVKSIIKLIIIDSFIKWVLVAIISTIIVNINFYLLLRKTKEVIYFRELVCEIFMNFSVKYKFNSILIKK